MCPNIAVDHEFAKNNDVKTGDTITIAIDKEDVDFCIGRIISSPDCISTVQNGYVYGNNAEFASVFMPEEYLLDSDYAHKCNQLLIFFEDWFDRDEALTIPPSLCARTILCPFSCSYIFMSFVK